MIVIDRPCAAATSHRATTGYSSSIGHPGQPNVAHSVGANYHTAVCIPGDVDYRRARILAARSIEGNPQCLCPNICYAPCSLYQIGHRSTVVRLLFIDKQCCFVLIQKNNTAPVHARFNNERLRTCVVCMCSWSKICSGCVL